MENLAFCAVGIACDPLIAEGKRGGVRAIIALLTPYSTRVVGMPHLADKSELYACTAGTVEINNSARVRESLDA